MAKKNYKHKTKNLPANSNYCMIAPSQNEVFEGSDESTVNTNRS